MEESICIQILRTSAKGIYNLTIFQAGSCAIQCDDSLFLYVPPWWFFHIGGNMLYLWIFGNNIEDAMGHGRFIFFYLLAGIVAAFAQLLYDPASNIPMIGATELSGFWGHIWCSIPMPGSKHCSLLLSSSKSWSCQALYSLPYGFSCRCYIRA